MREFEKPVFSSKYVFGAIIAARGSLGVPIGPIDAPWCGEGDGTSFGSYRDRPAKKEPKPDFGR